MLSLFKGRLTYIGFQDVFSPVLSLYLCQMLSCVTQCNTSCVTFKPFQFFNTWTMNKYKTSTDIIFLNVELNL